MATAAGTSSIAVRTARPWRVHSVSTSALERISPLRWWSPISIAVALAFARRSAGVSLSGFLGRVAEYYRAALQADPGHVGVLSYNPVNGAHTTTYPRFEPYGLGELARPIPKGWQIPKIPTTEVGRNSAYFTALCKRGLKDSDRELEVLALRSPPST